MFRQEGLTFVEHGDGKKLPRFAGRRPGGRINSNGWGVWSIEQDPVIPPEVVPEFS